MNMRTFCTLALAAMLAGCDKPTQPGYGGSAATRAAPPTITVGHVGHDHQIALGVAALEGEAFLRDAGIGLKAVKDREVYDLIEDGQVLARLLIKKVQGGSAMPAAMEAGQIEIGLGGVAPTAKFVDKGQPFRIIAPLHTDGDFLVMRQDSPLADWAGFVAAARKTEKPVRIGYKAPVAVAKLIFVRALAAEKIGWSEGAPNETAKVVMVNCHGDANMVPSLESGAIDGFVMNQPAASIAKVKGVGKIIADLRDLPPAEQWSHHPCCVVVAGQGVLDKHPRAVKALLKTLILATQRIEQDKVAAAKLAAEWTRTDPAAEADSVPAIPYLARPTPEYMAGLKTWAVLMAEEKQFTGALKDLPPEQVVERIADMGLCRQAWQELADKGLVK